MKKTIKNTAAILLLAGFVVLALGSFGSSPSSRSSSGSSSSSSSSSSKCSNNYECSKSSGQGGRHSICNNNNCSVVFVWASELGADCNCR